MTSCWLFKSVLKIYLGLKVRKKDDKDRKSSHSETVIWNQKNEKRKNR